MTLWKSKREQRWWKNPKMVEESKDVVKVIQEFEEIVRIIKKKIAWLVY